MKLPRDLSGAALAAALANVGDAITRRKSSHLRLPRHETANILSPFPITIRSR
jgi:hypothetical protein